MYDLGDVVPLTVTVTNAAGTAEDATAVTLTVTLPDGTTETPSVTSEGSGVYSVDYTPATVGHYDVAWVATGTNASAFTDSFNVYSTGAQLISLADAKAAVNFTDTTHDAELRFYIAAATDLIEQHVGPVVRRTVTEDVIARGGVLRLTQTPVVSVTTVTSVLNGGETYAAADLDVSSTGVVRALDRSALLTDLYTVTYVAGRAGVVPPRLIQACTVLVQHLWMTQRGSSSPGRNRSGSDDFAVGSSYTMPNRVLELLQWDSTGPLVG